ncbi:MAG: ATP-dependent DNA helicase RecG [Candidatus Limnocylindrales bacterium]
MPPAMARRLAHMGLATVRDLLFHLPRRYDDFSRPVTLGWLREVDPDGPVSARVRVLEVNVEQTWRRRVERTTARLADETGEAEAVWFGRRFIERRLHAGDIVLISGKVERRGWMPQFTSPEFGPAGGTALHAGRIVPVYRLTEGVTAAWLRRTMRRALDVMAVSYPDYLPPQLQADEAGPLPAIGAALEAAHYPPDFTALGRALARLRRDELLALQLGMVSRLRQRRLEVGAPIIVTDDRLDAAVAAVEAVIDAQVAAQTAEREALDPTTHVARSPSRLTSDQDVATRAIRADLAAGRPMMRLLQGDVGSGKTAVAALALAFVADAGRQGVLLAPTDLLARQHAVTLARLLEPLGHEVALLTGSLAAAERRAAVEALAAPTARTPEGPSRGLVATGTHALFESGVTYADLALVVVDEQHRFGVAQREAIAAKGVAPHVLLMTATPIPQTLGRVLHADLDVSDLRTRPAGRLPIVTGVRTTRDLLGTVTDPDRGAYPLLLREVAAGRRAFVVVPLVEEDEASGARSVAALAEELGTQLPKLEAARHYGAAPRIGVVHGQMPPRERDATMLRFRSGELNILVGTTVLEVGVDVPEASIMLIMDADRFGLAQLHQLRGRVGRAGQRAYCILVSDEEKGDTTVMARLQALVATQDGFELAEQDLRLRREGELLGLSQSGLPPLRVASLSSQADQAVSVAMRALAESLLNADGALVPGLEAFGEELRSGWLARVGAGDVLPTAGADDDA